MTYQDFYEAVTNSKEGCRNGFNVVEQICKVHGLPKDQVIDFLRDRYVSCDCGVHMKLKPGVVSEEWKEMLCQEESVRKAFRLDMWVGSTKLADIATEAIKDLLPRNHPECRIVDATASNKKLNVILEIPETLSPERVRDLLESHFDLYRQCPEHPLFNHSAIRVDEPVPLRSTATTGLMRAWVEESY